LLYSQVAKEQGLRSRAAFKLTQINRKYPVLEKAQNAVLDLCAAPGGWTQVAARTCNKSVPIIAVDILPIRSFANAQNITTLIGDITTDKCKSDIKHALQGRPVDVVLHDGAPNIGADYGKDAYEQNEIALHALRCATQHLVKGGTFITKLYRSRDYASFQWLLQQLFQGVQAFKPKASRAQSAEIFLVCEKYKAPSKLDPRLLDPKHVFEAVEGETTGGNMSANPNMTIFHKNWDKDRRKRGGYDHEHLDMTMRHVDNISSFVNTSGLKEAIQILSQSTGLAFTCHECGGKNEQVEPSCDCGFFLNHPLTSVEIKECVSDLQVLNKSDFKGLLAWRTKMQDALKARQDRQGEDESGGDDDDSKAGSNDDEEHDSDKEEEEIQAEIQQMRERRQREKKRRKKKERALAAKRRRASALGMDLNAIDVPDHDKLFSLAQISTKGDLQAASEVNLDQFTDEQLFGDSDDDIVVGEDQEDDTNSEDDDRLSRREKELNAAYDSYLQNTKDGLAKSGTKMAKRSKKLQRLKVAEEAAEDQEMAQTSTAYMKGDAKTYAKMLQGDDDSDGPDQDSEDEEDDGFEADPMTPEEHAQMQRSKKQKAGNDDANPLIHRFSDEPSSVKSARWFSNPLFQTIGKTAQLTQSNKSLDVEDEAGSSDSEPEDSKGNRSNGTKSFNLSAEDVVAMMPKTDKEKRHEKRLKQMARDERKKAKRAKKSGDLEGEFQIAPADEESVDEADDSLKNMTDSQRKTVLEARELIKAGMGNASRDDNHGTGFDIVSEAESRMIGKRPLEVVDDRKYDSDHEEYDSDDYAQTLALGTMMLRRSKEKALVDASYNRYAWNDPNDLPEWFVDDENKHYRPQLPIPPALIAKMKEKMLALSAKPIAKVAEARARKQKRAKTKLAAAKKQAEALANNSDMSEAMKLKAISKALRGQDAKRPGKSYVVAKKGRGAKGAKGVKVVDKRMKSDKRSMERTEKKRSKGKQNGLVGSKKRRNHK
jgi:AdoMet-dependent rRNA methyltransferase SPB1